MTLKKIIEEISTNRKKNFLSNLIFSNKNKIFKKFKDKKVLIIGAAGSIGSEFTSTILNYNIKELTIIDINENKMTDTIRDIRYKYPDLKTVINLRTVENKVKPRRII